ncbi:hypothetical protein [Limimaricola cinnabarinus]|nr:hypothetical protein [Limimaricola cinnabarinus]
MRADAALKEEGTERLQVIKTYSTQYLARNLGLFHQIGFADFRTITRPRHTKRGTEKMATKTQAAKTAKITHSHFERCAQDEADLVIRRIGAQAGVLKPLEQDWNANSNIFLRATGCSRDELKQRFARLDMAAQACNGAGCGSINMREIVELYEEELARAAAPQTGLAMLDQTVPDMSGAIAAKRCIG